MTARSVPLPPRRTASAAVSLELRLAREFNAAQNRRIDRGLKAIVLLALIAFFALAVLKVM